jgi:hypothetical protein
MVPVPVLVPQRCSFDHRRQCKNLYVLKVTLAKRICGRLYILSRPPPILAVVWIRKYFFRMDPGPRIPNPDLRIQIRIQEPIINGSSRISILPGHFGVIETNVDKYLVKY